MVPNLPKVIRCPTCSTVTVYDASNEFRPFCSERCKLLDLGAWADEEFRIPTEDHTTENQDDPDDEGPQSSNLS
jgi:endogenous inhibitor of DNA gyrase (YacG/DUF329 family)